MIETTPDTTAYLIAGYSVILGGLLLYMISLIVRWRALGRDEALAGRTLLVTAGPTREPVDPVRFIGNRSSGRMGYALAQAGWRRGCRVTLVTTAQFLLLSEEGLPLEEPRMLGTNELEVFTAPSDWPADRILSTSEDHDRYQTDMNDVNAFFPTTRMREFLEEGVFASLSRNYFRTLPNYSHRKTMEMDGPEILRQCLEDQVDVALLTPV